MDVNDYGSHQYWRFLDTGGRQYFQAMEIEMVEISLSASALNQMASALESARGILNQVLDILKSSSISESAQAILYKVLGILEGR